MTVPFARGVLVGLLLSIPFWIAIAVAIVWLLLLKT
jgi:hypothetical protein